MSKLNGIGKTHQERIFVVELKLKLRSLFHYEQIARENSDIKWMKVPSFSLTVTKYLTFQLSGYFLWTIKINCRRFLGRLSTNVMTLLFIQSHSETNIFLSTKVIFLFQILVYERSALLLRWWSVAFPISTFLLTSSRLVCGRMLINIQAFANRWRVLLRIIWPYLRSVTCITRLLFVYAAQSWIEIKTQSFV